MSSLVMLLLLMLLIFESKMGDGEGVYISIPSTSGSCSVRMEVKILWLCLRPDHEGRVSNPHSLSSQLSGLGWPRKS